MDRERCFFNCMCIFLLVDPITKLIPNLDLHVFFGQDLNHVITFFFTEGWWSFTASVIAALYSSILATHDSISSCPGQSGSKYNDYTCWNETHKEVSLRLPRVGPLGGKKTAWCSFPHALLLFVDRSIWKQRATNLYISLKVWLDACIRFRRY